MSLPSVDLSFTDYLFSPVKSKWLRVKVAALGGDFGIFLFVIELPGSLGY